MRLHRRIFVLRSTLAAIAVAGVALAAACGQQAQLPAQSAGAPAALTFTGSPIVGVQSQRCVDISGRSTTNGTQAQLWDCNGGTNQSWTYDSSTTKYLVVYGSKCLQASGGGTSAGTAVVIGDCTGQASQQWNVNADQTISNVQSGLCMDANGAATANGTKTILWGCGSANNQKWTISGATTTYALNVQKASTSLGTGTVTSSPSGINCDFTSGSACTASFAASATVTLTAATTGQNTFAGWSGACTGTSPTCTVSMSAARTVTAQFGYPDAQLFSLTVSRAGTGSGTVAGASISCGSTCSASFAGGSLVTLTAAAASGSAFTGWSGPCTGTSPTCVVMMTANVAVTAAFDLADPGSTLSVNVGGAASGTFVADAYFSGGSTYSTTNAIDTAQLAGTAPAQAVLQTERYGEFTYTIPNRTPSSAQAVTLYFVESYWTAAGQRTFNVALNGATVLTAFDIFASAGGVNKAIARTFNTTASTSGQVVIQLTKGGGPDNPKLCGLSVTGGVAPTFALTVTRAGTGSGTVTGGGIDCGSTCSASVTSGNTVILTAAAASGSAFTGWSGACSGTSPTCAVAMTSAQSVTATFAQGTSYSLTVTKAGTGSGTVTSSPAGINCGSTCTASYTSGTAVTLTATPGSGMSFSGWSGACAGTGACVVTLTANQTATATFAGSRPSTFSNPVLWNDLADIDILRVDDTYYYSASNMHYSPGAPILRSYDLVNWEYAGHSVPVLDFSSAYDLNGGRAYIKGTWASFLNYRKSNKTFYWGGCIEFARTYIYTAASVEGPWAKHGPLPCYYDAGLLIDDNDTMYVSYGNTNISVAQLSSDGFSQVRAQQVYTTPSSIGTLEGSRFYKRNGFYYIFLTRPANGQYVLRSTSPWGPYTIQQVLLNMGTPVSGSGVPHQGGLVQTAAGDWYYMAFVDAYPGGRIPVLAPIDWVNDWPVIRTVNGAWGATYPFPNVPASSRSVKPPAGTDTFTTSTLAPEWEWNHNPDNTRWSSGSGLRLQTATVTNDIYQARNTLTHRILGPTSTATIVLDYSAMRDGDRAGLVLLRDLSAWVGIRRDSGATRVAFVSNINMDGNWNTTSTGTEATSAAVSGGRIWLRLAADIRPGSGRQGRFSYSTDGVNFTQIGTYTMGNNWPFFMGYRYGMFNYATQSLGGSVNVESFTMTTP